MIYKSESGLDMRFSRPGMYGKGIYFAEESSYSDSYAFSSNNQKQMFLALVLVGDSVALPPYNDYNVPPCKFGSQTDRYDSIRNQQDKHFIVFENSRCYPGYLITYE